MELRHLRYFVAVAEEGSVTLAAERRLHTAQPSLSRQMRELETEVGAQLLGRSKVDVAFLRPEPDIPDVAFKHLTSEPLVVVLPSDHRLVALESIGPRDIEGETFVNVSNTAPTLRVLIDDYLRSAGVNIATAHEAASLSMAISLVASTRGVVLLPDYALNFLPRSVVSRPLAGDAPTIDLVLGYHKANTSPLLKLFLSRT